VAMTSPGLRVMTPDMYSTRSNTSNLIFNVFDLVEYISGVMTLNPGDVIATGTPSGVGPMEPGDEIAIEIQDIGVLKNKVMK
jgi:2-keto-4-pentenoate hydratase/2-oxohepta-3-ene-1,7-dioic acid hydratase in catechol pathway